MRCVMESRPPLLLRKRKRFRKKCLRLISNFDLFCCVWLLGEPAEQRDAALRGAPWAALPRLCVYKRDKKEKSKKQFDSCILFLYVCVPMGGSPSSFTDPTQPHADYQEIFLRNKKTNCWSPRAFLNISLFPTENSTNARCLG